MGTPRGWPSLIDFGNDDDDPFGKHPQQQHRDGDNPFEGDSWTATSTSRSSFPATEGSNSADLLSTPIAAFTHSRWQSSPSPSSQPDLLTGEFPTTPPTTIPGVNSATELNSWPSESSASDNPFDSPFDTPFGASSANGVVSNMGIAPPPVPHSRSAPSFKTTSVLETSTPEIYEKSLKKPASETKLQERVSNLSMRNSSSSSNGAAAHPNEFMAAGGGRGVYKPPARGPVDPDRPVPFDLRPSPMRTSEETRIMVCSDNAVWAACDGALRVWDINNAMEQGSAGQGNPADDLDAAELTLLPLDGSITVCLVADTANRIVWSGHRDGKIRAWHMDMGNSKRRVDPIVSWLAHRAPVLSMVITSFGELWSGSEAGAIRAWPWEATAHGLCVALEENLSAASLMTRSYIDLRARGTAAGATSLGNIDVHFLLADHSNGRVWSGGPLALALWDARTRDVLKLFGPSVQSEYSSPDISPVRDNMWDEDMKVTYAKVTKKEKTTGTLSFFQRSRIAVMGAADAVRRAASGGQGSDDSKKLEALIATVDGNVWGGYGSGMLVQWDSLGNRIQELLLIPVAVRSMCVVGTRIWVGYADGRIQVLAESGKPLGIWLAHSAAIIHMDKAASYVFTLARHGGIRGWNIGSPCPIDGILQIEMQSKADLYTQERSLTVLAGTWNVAEERASLRSIQMWLCAGAAQAGIVFVGLQETEMSAGALAMAAAKETVGFGFQDKGSANAQWWLDNLGHALGEGHEFVRVCFRQLAGILIGVWVRIELLPYVGEVDAAAVPCGFGRALGNKGAVGVRMLIYRRTFCFLSSHFAAHMDAVGRRNADFEHIFHQMKFGRSAAVPVYRAQQTLKRTTTAISPDIQDTAKEYMEMEGVVEAMLPELADADLIVWVGDFNYRIDDLAYEEVVDLISDKQLDLLISNDQLRSEMKAGRVFQGMREGHLNFQPTYKFDKGYNHILAYDSSEKRRVPAWCDRVIFRDSFDANGDMKKDRLSHPVTASVVWYDACMEVVDSDHKPVRCLINVDLAIINEPARRRSYCDLMRSNPQVQKWSQELNTIPEILLSTNKILLEDATPAVLKVINEAARQSTVYEIHCEGDPKEKSNQKIANTSLRAAYGFPLWLQVLPASGIIAPKGSAEISLRYMNVMVDEFAEDGGRSHKEDEDYSKRGKVVKLMLSVKGTLSSWCKRYELTVACSPNVGQLQQEREPNFRLQRSEVLVCRLSSHDTNNLLL